MPEPTSLLMSWLLDGDVALRTLYNAKEEPPTTSGDLEGDAVVINSSSREIASNSEAARIGHFCPEHRGALNDDAIPALARLTARCARLRFLVGHVWSVARKRTVMPLPGRPPQTG